MADTDVKKLRALVGDRGSRKKLIGMLEDTQEQLGDQITSADEAAIDAALSMLRNPNVSADQIVMITTRLTAKKYGKKVAKDLGQSAAEEFGLGDIDASGLLSAVSLFRSAASGDMKGMAKSGAKLILGKIVLGALCTIS